MKTTFQIDYYTQWGESLGIRFGNNTDAPFLLNTTDGHTWQGTADLDLSATDVPMLYRYGVWRDGECIREERCTMPHFVTASKVRESSLVVDRWQDMQRLAGVAVPVFSLRSEGSFGVGDFGRIERTILSVNVSTVMP